VAAALAAFANPVETLRAAPPSGVVAATMPSSAQWIVHEVIPGERLVEVADRYAVSTASIIRWNGLDPQRMRSMAGERLRIQTQLPSRQRDKLSYVVRNGDSWTKIARRYDVDPGTLEKTWNRSVRALEPNQRLLIWVEPGVVPKEDPIEPSIEDLTVPVPKGGESFGWPNGGRLLNGVHIPENPALYTVRNIDRAFGSTHAIEVMQRGLAAFRLRTRFEGEILLWDMSVKRGGRFGPHRSHRTGRDVDIAIPVKRGYAPDAPHDEAIDWPATWQLVRSFIETGEVKYIFMSRQRQAQLYKAARADGATPQELEEMIQFPRFTKYGIVRHSPGHHCHLHVRFSCGPNELGCME
jgi:murein endopeptidase/LysM repeat protein